MKLPEAIVDDLKHKDPKDTIGLIKEHLFKAKKVTGPLSNRCSLSKKST